MTAEAARVLAKQAVEGDLQSGSVYPRLANIRRVSLAIAVAVANLAWEQGLARDPRPRDVAQSISDSLYNPVY